ncbi:MAG: tetratricopeptide repeat protein [Chloroflexi bacterium]|nr:tetratricopeptide repeat protein [Chloroflexota bacterium]
MTHTAIKQKHGKDLLVTLRESTEGKSFDAILESEFYGIRDSTSRQAYLIVCCFYQHGAYIRDKLLAEMLGLSLTKLYDHTGDATEGVIRYDPLDYGSDEVYGARARHRVIAAVVWERCGDLRSREDILQTALEKLNLNYMPDKEAFDYFVRSDRLVDDIESLEGKIRFFDRACKKDPISPYVRQHYARMLLRSNWPDLALQQIEQALSLNPKLRVLYHTKGTILAEMALQTESLDIARRRLAQSEDNFKRVIKMKRQDDYGYQSLARLYFRWACRVTDEEEQTRYIERAEETISDGLRNARVRDSLWIVSSEIQNWLRDQESRIKALERAVRASPNSNIASYLLARAYRKQNQPEKAIEVLDPVLRQDLNEVRITTEYAISLERMGNPYEKAIAILNLSTLYGYSDSRFIATLGGLLFLSGKFTEADQVFRESARRNFSSRELNTIQFVPRDPKNLDINLRKHGKVVVVKAGYALVDVPDYPRIICPGSKFDGLVMREGMNIEFDIGFNARGPLVFHPTQIPE